MNEMQRQSRPVPSPAARGAERILIVDDEPGVRTALEAILADEGFQVTVVETGEAGLEQLGRQTFDAVMLDVWLPGIDGLETLEKIGELRFDTVVVMISGHGTIDTAVRATKLGAFDFVEKPLSLEKTLLVLRNALRQRRLERMNLHLLEQLSRDTEIIGSSAAVARLRREVDAAAASNAAVLIVGPQGSGRETVARRIHSLGRQADGPFVEVPCAALAPGAAETVLFGDGESSGRIALASGGSLFLEDADRLPAELQQRLAAQPDEAPLRLMVSSLPGADGLDPALRHQTEVLRIEVPPLRARREDVPLLAERFMRELSREYGKQPKALDAEVLAALQGHDWPGNVRELRNLMERLLLFSVGEAVRPSDLPEQLGGSPGPAEDLYREFSSLEEGRRAFERYFVLRILSDVAADRDRAAARLGIDREELEARLREI